MNIFRFFRNDQGNSVMEVDIDGLMKQLGRPSACDSMQERIIRRVSDELVEEILRTRKVEILETIDWSKLVPLIQGRILERFLDRQGKGSPYSWT